MASYARDRDPPLNEITELYLVKSGLSYIPEDIDRLSNLTHVVLWKNRLKHLPDSICNLHQLEVLDVRDNQLSKLPDDIGSLSCLRHLNVQKNRIKSLPSSISKLPYGWMSLSENRLVSLPQSIAEMDTLITLVLNKNRLNKLSGSDLEHLCSVIVRIPNLQNLHLGRNQLSTLPEILSELNVTSLWLTGNPMRVLQVPSLNCLSWSSLDISRMQLSKLPPGPKANKLTTLNVSHNRLKHVDKDWLRLSSLEELNLMNNTLDVFSDGELWMPSLRTIDLSNNRFQNW